MFVNVDNPMLRGIFYKLLVRGIKNCEKFKHANKKDTYCDLCITIDIETTDLGEVVFPYVYSVGFKNVCYATRHKFVFCDIIEKINDFLKNYDVKLVCFIHNLSYELSFFNGYFDDIKVFATDNNKPLYCDIGNIKVIDTYRLTNMSLDKLSKNYHLGHRKKVGNLDYDVKRFLGTKLTGTEKEYIANDVIILCEYWEIFKTFALTQKKVLRTFYTSTSVVRQIIDNNVNNRLQNLRDIRYLNEDYNPEVTQLISSCYTGAFVKSNNTLTRKVIKNVEMYDETSAYIGVLLAYKYPLFRYKKCDAGIEDILNNMNETSYLFTFEATNVRAKTGFSTISRHKCINIINDVVDNGRIKSCDYIKIDMCEVDLYLFKMFYDFDDYNITNCYYSPKDYLPYYIEKTVRQLYGEKQVLKYDPERDDAMYQLSKSRVNSVYGCCAEKNKDFNYVYDKETGEYEKVKNGKQRRTHLALQWSIYITAYARKNLLETCYKLENIVINGKNVGKNTVIYCDTDSIKVKVKSKKHKEMIDKIIKEYNTEYLDLIKAACKYYETGWELYKDIGAWDYEGHAHDFMSTGSKRYIYKDDKGKIHITLSGINKNMFKKFCDISHVNYYEAMLNDAFNVPVEYTNKLRHEVINFDDFIDIEGGNPVKGFTKLMPVDFTLKTDYDYKQLIDMLGDESENEEYERY